MNDIVLVGNDNKKQIDWMLARVLELIPGKDNITRLVKLKTSTGVILRPVQRLFPLELDTSQETIPFTTNDEKNDQISHSEQNDQSPRPTSIKEQVIKTFKKTRLGREVHPPQKLDL